MYHRANTADTNCTTKTSQTYPYKHTLKVIFKTIDTLTNLNYKLTTLVRVAGNILNAETLKLMVEWRVLVLLGKVGSGQPVQWAVMPRRWWSHLVARM